MTTPANLLVFSLRVLPLAQASGGTDLSTAFSYVVYILMLIGFVWGVIKCISGFASMRGGGGMDGMMEIVGGVGIAAAPIVMKVVFDKLCPGASVSPTAIQ